MMVVELASRWRVPESMRVVEEYDENIRGIRWKCRGNMMENVREEYEESVGGIG